MKDQTENTRRRFLKTAALAGGAATVAVAAGGAVADAVESGTKREAQAQPAGKQGYRVTSHVETYYRLARQ
jgi:nitrous oxide reductase